MTDPYYLIQSARKLVRKDYLSAKTIYEDAIKELEIRLDDSNQNKLKLWSAKAEYLSFCAKFIFNGETIEDARKRNLDSLRYIYKSTKMGAEYKSQLPDKIPEMIKNSIHGFGCILPVDESYVNVSCPIWLRNTRIGVMGLSYGVNYDKAVCSICNLELLDENCIHKLGKTYDDKLCYIVKKGFRLDHIAITDKPKDPRSKITTLSYPKDELYGNLDPDKVKNSVDLGLPLVCSNCRKSGFDPSEITLEKFFEMQNLSLDIE